MTPTICRHCGHEPGDHGDPDDTCRCCATHDEDGYEICERCGTQAVCPECVGA